MVPRLTAEKPECHFLDRKKKRSQIMNTRLGSSKILFHSINDRQLPFEDDFFTAWPCDVPALLFLFPTVSLPFLYN